MNLENYYTSSDLALAATISLWYPLDSIDKSNPLKALFVFKKDGGLDDLVQSFWKRELKVDPLTFFNQLKIIKTRLYEH